MLVLRSTTGRAGDSYISDGIEISHPADHPDDHRRIEILNLNTYS